MAQKDRITSNRVPHYDFGRHAVNYQTSNKGQFTQHDLSQAMKSKMEATRTGIDVRKSHFMFGTDTDQGRKSVGPHTTKAQFAPSNGAF